MTSKVEIANIALQKIGEEAIADLADNKDRARAVNRIYDSELRGELRAHPWNCAIKRAQLAALADAPAFGYAFQYQIPSDCLRVILSSGTDWQLEGRKILTNDGGPLNLRYVADITDPNDMDALLIAAFTSRLAMRLAVRLVNSNPMTQAAVAMYKSDLAEARKANAFESLSAERPEDSWTQALMGTVNIQIQG